MSEAQRKYVIFSAHHCAPNLGSEHAVGWNLLKRLAKQHAILLITEDNEFRDPIQTAVHELRKNGSIIDVFFVKHGSKTDGRKNDLRLFYYLTYRIYQRRVLRLATVLIRRYPVAAIHHVTIVGFREPGYLWKLGLPFIWGPVGGLVYAPRILFSELTPKNRLYQEIRNLITALQFHLSIRVKSAYKQSQRSGGAFIAATPDIGTQFRQRFGGKYHWIPETGCDQPSNDTRTPAERPQATPIRLLWVGALVDIKPLNMLLLSIAMTPNHTNRVHLCVIGDGESRPRYEHTARKLGVMANFLGWQPYRETHEYFREADLFVHLSIKDLTTNVVLESLSAGLPVLCLDHHGYSYIVTNDCGFKIHLNSPRVLVRQISALLDQLATDRCRLNSMKVAARERAREFTWDRNAQAITEMYDAALRFTEIPDL
jgi:glycosyltransferase involved in cell wall biosynthesis